MFDKDAIKKEIIEGSNIILKRYDENDVVESISVMNTKGHVIFLGSFSYSFLYQFAQSSLPVLAL